jgi:hypothetical protein
MAIQTYAQEIKDGMKDKVEKSSVCLTAACAISNPADNLELDNFIKTLKSRADFNTLKDVIGMDQPDLALLVSVLVSTGWNLNDDVFLAEELIAAKDTPVHKPIDYEHDPSIILGHMIKSRLVDKHGKEVGADSVPENFDIEVAGVLYKSMPVIDVIVKSILEKANSGNMFVSMECYFNDFSYSFRDDKGETRVVGRNDETSFLTKHLRVYGGSGEYKGYKIGRVLKNIVFGGQGLVENPANPDSVIRIAASKTVSEKDTQLNLTKGGAEKMDEEMKKKLEEALAAIVSKDEQIASLTKGLESVKELNKQEAEKTIAGFETKVKDLSDKLTVALETVKTLEAEKVTMAKELETVKTKAVEFGKELLEIKKREKATERFAKLSTLRTIEDKDKEAVMKEIAELSDETFETVCKYSGMPETKTEATASLKDVEVIVTPDVQVGSEKIEDELAKVALATANCLLQVKEKVKEGGE